MSIVYNEQKIRRMTGELYREFGLSGLIERIKELEAKVEILSVKREEIKPKRGRPRKVANG
jgi:hypothetical protein